MLSQKKIVSNLSFKQLTGLLLPWYCAHKHYTYGNYTLARVTKTTVLQQ